jgi:hypothetical protein
VVSTYEVGVREAGGVAVVDEPIPVMKYDVSGPSPLRTL